MSLFVAPTPCPLADYNRSDRATSRIDALIDAEETRAAELTRDPAHLAEGPLIDLVGGNEEAARELAHWLAAAIRMGSVPSCAVEAMEAANLWCAQAEIAQAVRS